MRSPRLEPTTASAALTMVKSAFWMLMLLVGAQTHAADVYLLDSANTQVSFEVRRFGISWVTAHFKVFSGDFVVDRQGSSSRVNVNVATASIECDDPQWNARLRSKEWLDTQQFPRMVYQSSRIEIDDGAATASGQLTLHGVTRPIVLNVSLLDCHGTSVCQFAAHARLKRSEYGLPHGFWAGGDQVEVSLSGVAVRRPM